MPLIASKCTCAFNVHLRIFSVFETWKTVYRPTVQVKKKKETQIQSKISPNKKTDIIELISENDSMINLLSFSTLVIHIQSRMTAQQSIL